MGFEEAPPEVRDAMRRDPRVWVRNTLRHPNRPRDFYDFRTNDGEPLHYIAGDDEDKSPLNPDYWGDINVLLMARGCLKTTSVNMVASWALDVYPYSEAFMSAPRRDQVEEFVEKFRDAIRDTSLETRREKNNISHQKFETAIEDGSGNYTVSSHLKTKSAWGEGEALRGPHSHIGILDEFQDVDEESFSPFLEVIDQSIPEVPHFPIVFIIGTPKMKNTFFEEMWKVSDQNTWNQDDLTWEQQSEIGEYAPPVICDICGQEVNEPREYCPNCSTELKADFDRSFTVRGWHIDQYNSPLHDEARIAFKREKYSPRRWQNEVLANFYDPEDDLLTENDIRGMLDPERSFSRQRRFDDSVVSIGVDWGGGKGDKASETVVWVFEQTAMEEGDYHLDTLKIDFVDPDVSFHDELELVEEYIIRYDADVAVVDEGYGSKRREDLQDGNGTMNPDGYIDVVKGCWYGNIKNKSEVKFEQDSGMERFFTCDRSHMMESCIQDIKDGLVTVPGEDIRFGSKRSMGTKLINHMTAPYKDYDETSSGKKKLKILCDDARNDDAMHAATYAWIGCQRLDNKPPVMYSPSTYMKGYA